MRQIVLDTETTGLEFKHGHRIIEIGCVELRNRRKTERYFHQYINPQREIDDGAFEIHGISNDFLSDKPAFNHIAREFIDFIRGAELIIHNAPFDIGFINYELEQLGPEWGKVEDYCKITDTLVMARERHPGQKNSLNALCQRYAVDNSQREQHGALLDARILMDVYLAMTGGQATLILDVGDDRINTTGKTENLDMHRIKLRVIPPDAEEYAAHQRRLQEIDIKSAGKCIWKKIENRVADE
jgi:DNA polymerase III subunit epsilon